MAIDVRREGPRATIEETDLGLLYRGAVEVDPEAGRDAIRRTSGQLVDLIRGIENPSTRPPRLEWTNVEVAVHLVQTFVADLASVEGTSTPYVVSDGKVLASGAKESAKRIKEEPERDPRKLATMLENAVDAFLAGTAERDPLQPVAFAEGHAMTLANLYGTLLGEVLVHGHDIAKGDGKTWTMDPEAARLAVYATTATLPVGVNPETTKNVDVRMNVRIRGGKCYQIHLHSGTGETQACGRADATVSTDAAALLLVGFGRVSPLVPALRGKMFAWGRRPDLPVRIGKYLLPI